MDSLVDEIATAYLDLVDTHAGGLIEGLYLEGSVALGDFRIGASDIDFVAVTARPPEAPARAILATIHEQIRRRYRRPFFDGLYLTWADLARDPAAMPTGPACHEGRFYDTATSGTANPVTWHTIAAHGIPVRGPEPAGLDIWTDTDVLTRWCHSNLDSYWKGWLTRGERLLSKQGLALLSDWGTVWAVTGVARLHYTITAREITSKTGAALYALDAYPDYWHQLISETLRIRRAEPTPTRYASRLVRRSDTSAFAHMVIAAAHQPG
ncbi:nucleotidyltransferase domain-containing protein [Nocardia colli]|uniref:nucleotidyltransferase domain-containing protein n=1 Tax=Nocardia colli TaxID=2545717 RepID=UPI0035E00B5B